MSNGGIERLLRQLAADGLAWVDLATVDSVEEHDAHGYLLNLVLQPAGIEVQARPLWLMGGAQGEGIYFPIAADDEVVVLFPGGDRNRAVALVGPPSTPAQPPDGWANDKIELVHSGGIEIRAAEGAEVEAVLQAAPFQADLHAYQSALETFMTTTSAATTASAIAAAAVTFLSTVSGLSLMDSLSTENYAADALSTE